MFGLQVTDKHDGYIGHRAIFQRGYIDILPDRGSMHGSEASVSRLIEWANKERKLPPPPGKKRARKITPWKQMLQDAADALSPSSHETWELRDGDFVIRCNAQGSYGYMYIALFEADNPVARIYDALKANPDECLSIAMAAITELLIVPDIHDEGRPRIIAVDEEYTSACDYLENVDAAIQRAKNVSECIEALQLKTQTHEDNHTGH